MNAIAPATTAPVLSGAAAMIPRSMRDAMELATMMAKTGFLPRQIQTPGGALFVIEQAMRWNMSPFAVATEVSFISDKPMFSGKIVAAAVQSSGVLQGRLTYAYSGEGDNRTITVSGTLRGETEPRTVTVRLADARTNNKVWVTQPDQQLAYHGARVWARRHAPEVMLGVYSPEEFDDAPATAAAPREVPNLATAAAAAPPTPPPPSSMREAVAQMQQQRPPADALPILARDGSLKRVAPGIWLRAVAKVLALFESTEAVREWRAAMGEHIAAVSERDELMAAEAERMIEARLMELADASWPGPQPGDAP